MKSKPTISPSIPACVLAVASIGLPLHAGDYTWTGNNDNKDWTAGANWTGASGYPDGSNDSATFPSGEGKTEVVLDSALFNDSVTGADVVVRRV